MITVPDQMTMMAITDQEIIKSLIGILIDIMIIIMKTIQIMRSPIPIMRRKGEKKLLKTSLKNIQGNSEGNLII